MKSFLLKARYGVILCVLATLFASFFILNFRERHAVKRIVDEENKRYLAGLLAEEFRIISRDLTNYARSYCVTKNKDYYDKYFDILQWSRGRIPRSDQHENSFASRYEGKKISHREILDDIGVPDAEKEAFLKAEALSDTLAEQEIQAMDSVRLGVIAPGPFPPLEGETVEQFVDRALYGESYHAYLEQIVGGVNEFLRLHQFRTDALFKDYRHFFSFGLFMQMLIQLGIVASVMFLILYLLTQARRQQEENRWLMLDAMPIGCMIRDSRLNLISCNREMLRMLGLKDTRDAVEHFAERSPEFQPNGKRSEEYGREMQVEAFENGRKQFRWIHWNSEGREFPVEVTLVRINQRNEVFTVAYTRDVSEEEATAREIINSEARMLAYQESGNRMQQMLNAIPVGIALFDENLILEECNDAEIQMFGTGTKERIMEEFPDLLPPFQPDGSRSRERMNDKFKAADEQGVQCFEWVYRKSDGTTFPAEVTLTRVQSGDRKILVACNRDLTKEKKMQAEVAHANERIRILFDTTPLCCTMLDNEFRAIDCNQEAVKMFGMSSKEEYLTNFATIFPEFQPNGILSSDFFRGKVAEAFKKGRVRFEGLARNMQGEEIPIEVIFIPLLMNDITTIAGYARDLRERKLLEKTEALSEVKMQFFANMSHEIRTPMNAIVSLSALLLEEPLEEKPQHYVKDIKTSADTLLSLINDLLDFSKLDAGKMQLVPRHYRFLEMLDHVGSTLAFAARNKGLDFSVEKNGELPECLFGDNIRLKQVLWNLIGNAIKFTKEGFVKLVVTDRDDRIGFDVIDSGIGIKESDIPILFEAFTQVDQQNTAHLQGTGLGLGICKSIVELMGGEIGVSSVYGKGTAFSFTIPKVPGDAAQIDRQESAGEQIVGSTAKILVVDDNEINLNVATGVFGSLGMEIDTASSGKEAIRMVRQTDYDIVFMDHMMPEMDGVETTRRIRILGEKYEKLPIIALTANAVYGAREMLIESGLDGFVSKPIDRTELGKVLMEFLPKEKYRVDHVRQPDAPADRSSEELKTRLMEGAADLNVPLGVVRSGGNWNTFVTSVKMLNRKMPGHIAQLNRLPTEETLSDYAIEVHGMKGVLAGLGCDPLAAEAAELERAAKSGDAAFCRENTGAFTDKLKKLNADLSDVFIKTESSDQSVREKGDIAELANNLKKIEHFLDDYDTDFALALVKKMNGLRFDLPLEEKLARLEQLIEEFDYDTAKNLSHEIGADLEKHRKHRKDAIR